jgi:hypothetical protein
MVVIHYSLDISYIHTNNFSRLLLSLFLAPRNMNGKTHSPLRFINNKEDFDICLLPVNQGFEFSVLYISYSSSVAVCHYSAVRARRRMKAREERAVLALPSSE